MCCCIFYSSSGGILQYKTISTGEQYLQVRPSSVVGISGRSTGYGLFTIKCIEQGQFITSYAPLAPVRPATNSLTYDSNYVLKTSVCGSEFEIDGQLCPIGLGQRIQDGSFPFFLAPEKFSGLLKTRINCEFAKRENTIWFKATRPIQAGEELFVRYSHNNSYWTTMFKNEPSLLPSLRQALLTATDGTLLEAERILKNF